MGKKVGNELFSAESKPTSPIPPISVWAIPFLSTREALQLYDLLDEDTKVRAKATTYENLGNLIHLNLYWNKIDEEGIQAIHENLLPRLDYLYLSTNSIKENPSTHPKRIKGKIFKFL